MILLPARPIRPQIQPAEWIYNIKIVICATSLVQLKILINHLSLKKLAASSAIELYTIINGITFITASHKSLILVPNEMVIFPTSDAVITLSVLQRDVTVTA